MFLDVFLLLFFLSVQINSLSLQLKLYTDHFFVSGQMYKISRGSNHFFPQCIKPGIHYAIFALISPRFYSLNKLALVE